MKLKKVLLAVIFFFSMSIFAQNSVTEINTQEGIHYISPSIDYPVSGTYLFKGGEPIVELNSNGTGYYQLHDQTKRPISWGFECKNNGEPIFIKGFDSAEYKFWYKYTDATNSEFGIEEEWKKVEFSIHFNSNKMFINGERVKGLNVKVEK